MVTERSSSDLEIDVSVDGSATASALATVDAGLDEHNAASASLEDVRPLHVIATDEHGKVCGGAIGRTWGQCCELLQLWVAAAHRSQKVGTRLMDAYEREAAARGCRLVYLDSFSFQAPEFYVQRGYVEALRTAGFPGGIAKITLHKRLR